MTLGVPAAMRISTRLPVERLEQIEHRAVLVLEEPRRDAHVVIRRHSYKIMVVRTVMDRAQRPGRCSRPARRPPPVSDDVRSSEEATSFQTADRALFSYCAQRVETLSPEVCG